jgi:Zn-dependent protease
VPFPALTELFAAVRRVQAGDREVLFALLLPGLRPDDPAVRGALAGWPGTHWASRAGDGWEVVLERRVRPARRERWWLHALLLLGTLFSTALAGATLAGRDPLGLVEGPVLGVTVPLPTGLDPHALASGLLFALPMLGVLLAHELGHYAAARRHGLDVSPPFFIPAPHLISLIGTFGAFIRLRSPMLHRRMLMEVGAAGPLAGFVLALPVAAVGLAMSRAAGPLPAFPGAPSLVVLEGFGLRMGDSLLWLVLRALFAPGGGPLILHPVAVAGWVGLFFTAMNLLPVAQLDGGHILYALLGERWQRGVALLFFVFLVLAGWLWPGWWLWAVLVLAVGRGRVTHPPVLDPRLPLTRAQGAAGWACVALFILAFVPIPIR